jgi:hypothetical protein
MCPLLTEIVAIKQARLVYAYPYSPGSIPTLTLEPSPQTLSQKDAMNALFQRLVGRFVPASLPPSGTFDGQTVLIAGSSAGLGLHAAVHFATLGASVIITSRVASRGNAAIKRIEQAVVPSYKGQISCLELDLESYESCTSFVNKLKTVLPDPAALDIAILNGGMVASHWEQSEAGWYVISATILASLISQFTP